MKCALTGMRLIMWMLQHLGAYKGFFTISPAKSPHGVHTQAEVDAYIHKCIAEDVMGVILHAGCIVDMWRDESQKKSDEKGSLFKMGLKAERQVSMGYLTPHVLAVLDTLLYSAVRGGVNTAFDKGCGPDTSSNQPEAIVAHDAYLLERAKFHFRYDRHVAVHTHA